MAPIFNLNIQYTMKAYENNLKGEISKLKYPNNDFDKRCIILKQRSSTKDILERKFKHEQLINNNNSVLSNSNTMNVSFILDINPNISNISNLNSTDLESTLDETNSPLILENTYITKQKKNKFNCLRSKFYLENKLYDISLYADYNNFYIPKIYILNEKYSSFLYNNDETTFCCTISGFIKNDKIVQNELTEKINESVYNDKYGLYFCNKNVEITKADQALNKKCEPNQFMCRDCMEINKTIYNIKSKYLININGRVAKINKGSYHCFGHYLDNNQIEDCITKFTCKACTMLNTYSDYFIKGGG